MRIFDANCRIGRYNRWSGREPITAPDLLRSLDHYGIHEALVTAALAREYHAIDGNEQVMRLTEGEPRLHPAWVGLPPRSRELPPMGDLVAEMEERGVRALFLYPRQYRFTLDDWCVDAMLGPLAERRVPLFLCPSDMVAGSPADQTEWPGVVRLCRAFPELPVVVTENRILRTLRTVYQALDACPNLHLDISALWLHHVIEFITREWGAERLLFGSDLPEREPGATLGQMLFSDVAPDELAAMAGGNLRQLLTWGGTLPLPETPVDLPAPVDELHAIAREGGSLEGQGFLCAHGHIGRHTHLHIPDETPADLVQEMDRVGVQSSLVFSNAGLNSDEVYGNDLVALTVRAFPERFRGLLTVNPNRTVAEMEREMHRGFDLGMLGIKIHPYLAGYDTLGEKVEVPCAFAHERHAFVLNHYWGDTERLLYLCRKYPDAIFMTGHTAPEAKAAMAEVDNLYVGTCPLLGYEETARWVEEGWGDRLLFGSDLSWNPIGWGLGPVLYAKVPLEAKRLILGGNFARLLASCGPLR